ncbi:hypothetical protein U1Q18_038723 [Sarracenia purpurea var. burkii]
MDPPPASAAADAVDSFPNPANPKLRLMCSYGGRIVSRPRDKSFCYAGGDTRIVAVDRRTTAATVSALTDHLSRTLFNNRPLFLKYQLPDEDLDALVSVTTDEDLQNMLEEHDQVASSAKPCRIRLFLFPSKAESVGSSLLDSKAESWFCDALRSTKIMQRGQNGDSGLVNGFSGVDCGAPAPPSDSSVEAQIESLINSGEVRHGLDLGSVPESMVLETNSSFGSTSSSSSMSNLPPIGQGDEGGVNLHDKKVKVPSPASVESDNRVASALSHPQTPVYQDPFVHVSSMETRVSSGAVEVEEIKIVNNGHLPYIHAGAHYLPQHLATQFPISSFQPMYYPPLYHHPHNFYQPNQPYQGYLLPIRPTQSYVSMQCNLLDTSTAAMSMSQMHPITYKEVTEGAPLPESASKVLWTVVGATPLDRVPSNQNQQPLVDLSELHNESQSVAAASMAAANYENEDEDDLVYAQIYKTQPSAPALLSQYQTMTNASGTLLLSEASKILHADNVKQHIGASQPQ